MSDDYHDPFDPKNNPMLTDGDMPDPRKIEVREGLEFGRTKELRIIKVGSEDSIPSLVPESSESGHDENGNWKTKYFINIYIDEEDGNPINLWPNHPQAWISYTGKLIWHKDQRGVCCSSFHTGRNFNVKLGIDGDIHNGKCFCNDCKKTQDTVVGFIFIIGAVAVVIGYFSI
ncbi:MAG: hypothetical protein KQJ78_25950 [Deltaproteobacteria bacterium]|nr:hypothetical protein [Deltaproteobacteria bacterium]